MSTTACTAGPSALLSGRTPAFCDGNFVGMVAKAPAADDVCMLTPVHGPNFAHLARRLEQTARLSTGPPPTTVVVFDDPVAHRQFCQRFATACVTPGFVPLDLRTLIGHVAYSAAQRMLRTGGSQSRERLRDAAHGDDTHARACFPKFGGQCYQSLKKLYGAAQGPSACRVYWVSDAESYPFRRFNLSSLAQATLRGGGKPFLLVPSWYPNRYGCSASTNMYDDGDCAVWIASSLALGGSSSRRRAALAAAASSRAASRRTTTPRDAPGAGSYLAGSQRAYQTVFDLNNWWFYDREMARAVIDRTEQSVGSHFVDYFATLQVTDINFWRTNLEYLTKLPGSPMVVRDYLRVLERHFPVAFARCCSCRRRGATNETQPCYALTHLWTPCFLTYATPQQLAAFLVDQLGVFGIFGNEIDAVPDAVLRADERISWVVNNAYKWRRASLFAVELPSQS